MGMINSGFKFGECLHDVRIGRTFNTLIEYSAHHATTSTFTFHVAIRVVTIVTSTEHEYCPPVYRVHRLNYLFHI